MRRMRRAGTGLLVGSSPPFRGWDKFLVNAVCCHATKTISLYHDPILSAYYTIAAKNVRPGPQTGRAKIRGRLPKKFLMRRRAA